jgi:hypothetical protein
MNERAHSNALKREYGKRTRRAIKAGQLKPGASSVVELNKLRWQRDVARRGGRPQDQLLAEIHSLKAACRDPQHRGFSDSVSATIVRPKNGDRVRILKEVAAAASKKFGRVITPHMVDACWKEYRREILRPLKL